MTPFATTRPRALRSITTHFFNTRGALVGALLLGLAATSASARIVAGTHHDAAIPTPRDYKGNDSGDPVVRWTYVLEHPGATYIAIRFADFNLAPGDYLVVSDERRGQAYALDGRGKMNAGDFWAQHIKGDTAVLELYVTNPEGGRGFRIDEYVAGFLDLSGPPTGQSRAICGTDDKESAKCYELSHPTEYDRGRAVARLLSNGSGFCTGWLASSEGMLITNEHCITSNSEAMNTDYEFMAESSGCNTGGPIGSTIFSGGTLIQDNSNLDYALIQVNGNPAAQFGYLEIDDRVATVGEEMYIIGHPGGRLKEFTIFSTHPSDSNGIAIVQSITAPACTGSGYNDVGYYADTEGGSSGSPVLARNGHKVIALHHCANCLNRGVPINLVYAEIGQYLTPGPAGTLELDKNLYGCADTVAFELRDGDLLGTGSSSVDVTTTGGDTETIVVTETPLNSGVFLGAVPTASTAVTPNDGTLQVNEGETITASYLDADDGQGGLNILVTDTALTDCTPPQITSVQTASVNPRDATVTVSANEPVQAIVYYGLTCGATLSASSSGYQTTASVTLPGLQDNATYFYSVEVRDEGNNAASDDNSGACYTFSTPEVPDFFTEQFDGGFDLADMSVTFTPNGSVDFYGGCAEAITALPNDPAAGTPLTLSDDDSEQVSLAPGRSVSLYGVSYNAFYVGSNGYLTFTAADTDYTESLNDHFDTARVSALFDDLNPASGGTITWQELADRVVVSFVDVPEYSATGANTFQYELFDDGRIRLSYGNISAGDGITGLSAGDGLSPDFLAQDLSLFGPCDPTPPIASDAVASLAVGETVPVRLSALDDGLPNPPGVLTFTIESLPVHGQLHEPTGNLIDSVPYTLPNGREVRYTANIYYTGSDTFTFSANDGGSAPLGGDSNIATVTMNITTGKSPAVTFNLDSDPGWTTEGDWAFGTPLGGGSHNADPTGGATGQYVYGYNLSGDYENQTDAHHLTTTAIDCSQIDNVELRFMRWLGVELHDGAYVSVSNDGVVWSQVWSHGNTSIADLTWIPVTLDISHVADHQSTVYIRWTMGETDDTITYPGWNIDDVTIWGTGPVLCQGDTDCDGDVDFDDITLFVTAIGDDGSAWAAQFQTLYGFDPPCAFENGDFDGDSDVDFDDITPFVEAIGTDCRR